MEEEECDYRTPIGKVIKHINTLCKKPQVDDKLSEALDLFTEKLEEQENYLINGIVKINFAEAALFLQSATQFYGKKVDLLWDELLEFHTRLITYDCENQRKKGLSVDKEVIEKLEERRNRYKRKKIFKLILQETEKIQKLNYFLFDEDKENKGKKVIRGQEKELRKAWKEYEHFSREMRKIPKIVYKQMTQMYRMKNYHVMKSLDYEIWDPDDDEFNTRYSRIPSWHHIQHLFEYNDKGLLPDQNNIIARLRLSVYARLKFMLNRGIPFNTPFEEYREEYMAYREEFFAEEAKKWQNMPLNTLEDLYEQLKYLAQKERAEEGEPAMVGEIFKVGRYGVKVVDRAIDDEIEILDSSDEEELFELSFSCDKDFMKSDLYVRLEKLSSEIINTKLRQDSGFFDFNSDSDHDCDDVHLDCRQKEDEGAVAAAEDSAVVSVEGNTDVPTDNGKDVYKNVIDGCGTDIINQDKNGDDNTDVNHDNFETKSYISDHDYCGTVLPNLDINVGNNENDATGDTDVNHDNLETGSFVSDHDYCLTVPPNLESSIENIDNDSGVDENVDNAKNDSINDNLEKVNPINGVKPSLNKTVEEIFAKPLCTASRIIPKIVKITENKEKRKPLKEKGNGESPPKRRKLSQKQIDKLLKSKIRPVKLMKFENFFSMNYLAEFGEGDVPIVEYESDYELEGSDSEYPDLDLLQDVNENHANVIPPVHDDDSDTRSVYSDHDYCLPTAKDANNDSGFLEGSSSQAFAEDESSQKDQQENSSNESNPAQSNVEDSTVILKNESEKVLEVLNEGSVNTQNDIEIEPRLPNAKDLEWMEIQKARERVDEWRNRITPMLRSLKEQEFDIHEYGSKIMEGLEINESKPFSDMVQGKSSAEVVRYFISSLQLANTNNIEICGAQKGKLSNDTYQVKLLTKERYHEHLNEYLAPSVETLREKLDKMRAMNTDNVSADEPPAKKFKLVVTPSRPKRNTRDDTPKKKSVVKNKKKPLSSSNHNIQAVQLTAKIVHLGHIAGAQSPYQTRPCKVILNPVAQEQLRKNSNVDQSEEELNSENARRERLLAKGKSIIKRPIVERSQEPYILNADISMPSTSGQSTWYRSYSHIDPQMPSTSYQRFTPSPDLERTGFSYNLQAPSTTSNGGSSNQIRRESTEEAFRQRLVIVQEMNPDVQLQSTPNAPSPSKQLKTSMSLKRSLMFE